MIIITGATLYMPKQLVQIREDHVATRPSRFRIRLYGQILCLPPSRAGTPAAAVLLP